MWFFILIIDGKGLKRRTHDRLIFLPCVLYALLVIHFSRLYWFDFAFGHCPCSCLFALANPYAEVPERGKRSSQPATCLALLLFQEDQLAQVIGYMVGTVDHNVQLVAVWFF